MQNNAEGLCSPKQLWFTLLGCFVGSLAFTSHPIFGIYHLFLLFNLKLVTRENKIICWTSKYGILFFCDNLESNYLWFRLMRESTERQKIFFANINSFADHEIFKRITPKFQTKLKSVVLAVMYSRKKPYIPRKNQ